MDFGDIGAAIAPSRYWPVGQRNPHPPVRCRLHRPGIPGSGAALPSPDPGAASNPGARRRPPNRPRVSRVGRV